MGLSHTLRCNPKLHLTGCALAGVGCPVSRIHSIRTIERVRFSGRHLLTEMLLQTGTFSVPARNQNNRETPRETKDCKNMTALYGAPVRKAPVLSFHQGYDASYPSPLYDASSDDGEISHLQYRTMEQSARQPCTGLLFHSLFRFIIQLQYPG